MHECDDNAAKPGVAANGPEGIAKPPTSSTADLLTKLAHELKTPLSAVVAAAAIMRDERFGALGDARYQRYASGIHDSAQHALGVIDAMLGGGLEGGDSPSAAVAVDLNAVAAQVARALAALFEVAGLSIECRLQPGLPHPVADPLTVRQMLLNLATNAMRATPPGGTVVITTAGETGGPVRLAVTDTGRGMDAAEIAAALAPRTGEPHKLTNESSWNGGRGLGFPLLLAWAARSCATLAITSPGPNAGTTVTLTFAAERTMSL